ncbi:hypothetical protein BDV06DRAFT_185405 [Aspergillus oleicola]
MRARTLLSQEMRSKYPNFDRVNGSRGDILCCHEFERSILLPCLAEVLNKLRRSRKIKWREHIRLQGRLLHRTKLRGIQKRLNSPVAARVIRRTIRSNIRSRSSCSTSQLGVALTQFFSMTSTLGSLARCCAAGFDRERVRAVIRWFVKALLL